MKKVVLITGASGMLAKHLFEKLRDSYSVRFLTRNKTQENEYLWDLRNDYIDINALKDVHAIIHLAGSSIADKRWTKDRKKVIISSRVDGARLILENLKKHKIAIDTFISASAIGYYGISNTDTIFTEESPKGNDFLSEVCSQWETAAQKFKSSNVAKRVAIVRIGLILDKKDGVLSKLLLPIKYGLGSGIGSGNQFMPWIHIDDLCSMVHFILQNKELVGAFNGVSPEYITNNEFIKKIGKTIDKRIILPNIPKFLIQGLFGEMSTLFLNGNKVSSDKIISKGFKFKYKNSNIALKDLLEKK